MKNDELDARTRKCVEDVVASLNENVEPSERSVRERLILAAIDEVQEFGFSRLSVRRIATACGVSCSAPYKHFKNKREIVEAILLYINSVWDLRQDVLLKKLEHETLRVRLVELALEFVRFLVENPQFRTVLMISDETLDSKYLQIKSGFTAKSKELIREYCLQTGVLKDVARTKMNVVRSLIYGGALMYGNGELTYCPESLARLRAAVDREFDLPKIGSLSEPVLNKGRRRAARKTKEDKS